MDVIVERPAALDVHKATVTACVRVADEQGVRADVCSTVHYIPDRRRSTSLARLAATSTSGCMMRIRNLYTHNSGADEREDLEALAALSLLARWARTAMPSMRFLIGTERVASGTLRSP